MAGGSPDRLVSASFKLTQQRQDEIDHSLAKAPTISTEESEVSQKVLSDVGMISVKPRGHRREEPASHPASEWRGCRGGVVKTAEGGEARRTWPMGWAVEPRLVSMPAAVQRRWRVE